MKVNDIVYIWLKGIGPAKARIVRIIEEEYGIFWRSKRNVYLVQLPEQDWGLWRYKYEIKHTMGGWVY